MCLKLRYAYLQLNKIVVAAKKIFFPQYENLYNVFFERDVNKINFFCIELQFNLYVQKPMFDWAREQTKKALSGNNSVAFYIACLSFFLLRFRKLLLKKIKKKMRHS